MCRHPKYEFHEIINYLESSLKKVVRENKEACGVVVHTDLFNYQLHYNLLCSLGFFRFLSVQPTR